MVTTLIRFKYYFAWTFADATCNNAGIGFNGFDVNGNAKWDRFSNVDILKFEVSKKSGYNVRRKACKCGKCSFMNYLK